MPIDYHCPQCGGLMQVDENQIGHTGPCPLCGQTITIAMADVPTAIPVQSPNTSSGSKIVLIVLLIFGAIFLFLTLMFFVFVNPAMRAAETAKRDLFSSVNMRKISIAMLNYETTRACFANDGFDPPRPRPDMDEPQKPLLSRP